MPKKEATIYRIMSDFPKTLIAKSNKFYNHLVIRQNIFNIHVSCYQTYILRGLDRRSNNENQAKRKGLGYNYLHVDNRCQKGWIKRSLGHSDKRKRKRLLLAKCPDGY